MNKIDRYLDSLLGLPGWIGLPVFLLTMVLPTFLLCCAFFLLVMVSPWFLLLPVTIWLACVLNWLIKEN